jgi:hypothetical protein
MLSISPACPTGFVLPCLPIPARAPPYGPRWAYAVFRHACSLGLEGIVAKRRDRPYCSGRCADWVKVKNPDAPAATQVIERSTLLCATKAGSVGGDVAPISETCPDEDDISLTIARRESLMISRTDSRVRKDHCCGSIASPQQFDVKGNVTGRKFLSR